jgi:hypothetical protein
MTVAMAAAETTTQAERCVVAEDAGVTVRLHFAAVEGEANWWLEVQGSLPDHEFTAADVLALPAVLAEAIAAAQARGWLAQ